MSSKDGQIGGPDIDNEFQERKGGEEVEGIQLSFTCHEFHMLVEPNYNERLAAYIRNMR